MLYAALLTLLPQAVKVLVTAPATAKSVVVVGTFNDWKLPGISLAHDREGQWHADLRLEPGAYLYRVVVDGDVRVLGTPPFFPDPSYPAPSRTLLVLPPDYKRSPALRGDGQITEGGVVHHGDARDVRHLKGRTFEITLRTRHDDVANVTVAVTQGKEQKTYPMVLGAEDPVFDLYRAKIVVAPGETFTYRFGLDDGAGMRTFATNGLSGGVIGGPAFRQDPAAYPETDDSPKPRESQPRSM